MDRDDGVDVRAIVLDELDQTREDISEPTVEDPVIVDLTSEPLSEDELLEPYTTTSGP